MFTFRYISAIISTYFNDGHIPPFQRSIPKLFSFTNYPMFTSHRNGCSIINTFKARRMCTTRFYKARHCGHKWLAIDQPCGVGKGFNNCGAFKDGRARYPPESYFTYQTHCPYHASGGNYDRDKIRMIEKTRHGIKIGVSPDQAAPGLTITCCLIQ